MQKISKLITNMDVKQPIVESYKTLRTNIQFSNIDKSIKTVLITSPGPSEGKSTTAANLAITMAQSDLSVLLIDCDMRKPSQHKLFRLMNVNGLTNILAEKVDYTDCINDVGIPNLSLITSGPKPPNPSELLGSVRMKSFIGQIKDVYDLVILDTPPVVPVTDAAVLSQYVDGAILVVSYGICTYEAAQKAEENLKNVKANILGVVLNKVPQKGQGGYYYYYYYDEAGNRKKKKKHSASHRGSSVNSYRGDIRA